MNRDRLKNMRASINRPYLVIAFLFFTISGGCSGMTVNGSGDIIQHIGTIQNESGQGVDIIRWHPDSRHIAVTGSQSRYIYVWDVQEKKLLKKLDKKEKHEMTQMTYSPDGKYLIGRDPTLGGLNKHGKKPGHFVLWSVAENYRLVDDSQEIYSSRYLFPAPDGRVYSYENGSIRYKAPKLFFYEIPSMRRFESHLDLDGPDTITFSNDGRYMAEGYKTRGKGKDDDQYHLRMWKYPEMELVWDDREIHNGNVESIAFSPDDMFLVTGPYASDDRFIKDSGGTNRVQKSYLEPLKLWDARTGKFIRDITQLTRTPMRLHFLDSKHIMGVTSIRREIKIWDFDSGKVLANYTVPRDSFVYTAELSPDRKTLAFGKKDTILLFHFKVPEEAKPQKLK